MKGEDRPILSKVFGKGQTDTSMDTKKIIIYHIAICKAYSFS